FFVFTFHTGEKGVLGFFLQLFDALVEFLLLLRESHAFFALKENATFAKARDVGAEVSDVGAFGRPFDVGGGAGALGEKEIELHGDGEEEDDDGESTLPAVVAADARAAHGDDQAARSAVQALAGPLLPAPLPPAHRH